MKRQLFSDGQLIESLLIELTLIESNNVDWTKTYLDSSSGDKWLSYYPNSEQHGGGHIILSRLPLPDTNKLIDIALFSDTDDEVFAACCTLTGNEQTRKNEFRAILIDKLERINDTVRQNKIIEYTGLTSSLNRHDILGKTVEQINLDSRYFKDIADRANRLIK